MPWEKLVAAVNKLFVLKHRKRPIAHILWNKAVVLHNIDNQLLFIKDMFLLWKDFFMLEAGNLTLVSEYSLGRVWGNTLLKQGT